MILATLSLVFGITFACALGIPLNPKSRLSHLWGVTSTTWPNHMTEYPETTCATVAAVTMVKNVTSRVSLLGSTTWLSYIRRI
jgi:hypothetical protein